MATEVGALSRVLSLRTWIRPNSSILDTHGARGCASDISGPLTVFSLCGEQVRGVVTVLAPEPWPEQEGDGWNSLDLEAQPRHSASSHPACHPFSFLYAPLCMWPTFARTKVPVLTLVGPRVLVLAKRLTLAPTGSWEGSVVRDGNSV